MVTLLRVCIEATAALAASYFFGPQGILFVAIAAIYAAALSELSEFKGFERGRKHAEEYLREDRNARQRRRRAHAKYRKQINAKR